MNKGLEEKQSMTRAGRVLWMWVGILVLDVVVAVVYARSHGLPLWGMLNHWDSNWFADLLEHGRGPIHSEAEVSRWAFLPLNLWITQAVQEALPFLNVYVAGAFVSCVSTALALFLMAQPTSQTWTTSSMWGWALWLLSPGSFAFFTFHTEGLFLLWSVWAWKGWFQRKLGWVCVACVLAVWTRNQGTLLGVSLAAVWFWQQEKNVRWKALWILLAVGLGQVGLMSYAWFQAGDAWAFFRAQSRWDHAQTWVEIVGTLVMWNEAAPMAPAWWGRTVFAWGWLLSGLGLWRRSSSKAFSIYAWLSFLPMLLQGQFHNVFRFSAVVFPLFFYWGERLEKARPVIKGLVLCLWALLHVWNWTRFVKDAWAY